MKTSRIVPFAVIAVLVAACSSASEDPSSSGTQSDALHRGKTAGSGAGSSDPGQPASAPSASGGSGPGTPAPSGSAGSGTGTTGPGQRTCTKAECGPAPGMPNWQCSDGSYGGPTCDRNAAGACGWTIRQCPTPPPPPPQCDPASCGPQPLDVPNVYCQNGGGELVCAAANGQCGWVLSPCK